MLEEKIKRIELWWKKLKPIDRFVVFMMVVPNVLWITMIVIGTIIIHLIW
jgi:hypothetical protein